MSGQARDTQVRPATVRKAETFALVPSADERTDLAARLGIEGIRKLTFGGTLAPTGGSDIALDASLGATVVQACVVTDAPVTTRIDVPVVRRYVADLPEPEGDEIEMPQDDSAEPLPAVIDLALVMEEALALALPDYPRAEGVAPVEIAVTEPGAAPMTDDDARPFAALKALKDRLGEDG